MVQNNTTAQEAIQASKTMVTKYVSAGFPASQVVDKTIETSLRLLPFTLTPDQIQAWHDKLLAFAKSVETSAKSTPVSSASASTGSGSSIPPVVVAASSTPTCPFPAVLGKNVDSGELLYLPQEERTKHVWLMGGSGSGKSTAAVSLIDADSKNGVGVCVIDPTGDLIKEVLALPSLKARIADTLLYTPGVSPTVWPFNLLKYAQHEETIDKAGDKLMDFMYKLWKEEGAADKESMGHRLENITRTSSLTLMHNGLSLAEMPFLLDNAAYRARLVQNLPPQAHWLQYFWEERYNKLTRYMQESRTESTYNKLMKMLTIQELELMLCQNDFLNIRQLLDTRKIILLDLSKAGKEAGKMIGTLLLTQIFSAVMQRGDVDAQDRPFFGLYIDEFHIYLSPIFQEFLTQTRKYNLGVTVIHQDLDQLNPETVGAVMQLGTQGIFRQNVKDAPKLAPAFAKEPQPDGEQAKALLATRPIDFVVGRGISHASKEVTEFFYSLEDIVRLDSRPTDITPSHAIKKPVSWSNKNRYGEQWRVKELTTGYTPSHVTPHARSLENLNNLFFLVMETKQPLQIVPRATLRFCINNSTLTQSSIAPVDTFDEQQKIQREIYLITDEVYEMLWLCAESDILSLLKQQALENRKQYTYWHTYLTERLHSLLTNLSIPATGAYTVSRPSDPEFRWTTTPSEEQDGKRKEIVARQWAAFTTLIKSYGLDLLNLLPDDFQWHHMRFAHDTGLTQDYHNWYVNHEITPRMKEALEQEARKRARVYSEQAEALPTHEETILIAEMIRLLRYVLAALASNPIYTQTPHIPTSREMIDQAADRLLNLPDHRAYIKRGSSGVSPVLIETLRLPSCDTWELEERIKQAVQNASYYGVKRSRLEEQLQERYEFNTTGMLPAGKVVDSKPETNRQTAVASVPFVGVTDTASSALQTEHPILSTTNYLELTYYLSNLTLLQAMKLTGTTDKKKERNKLTRLVTDGLAEIQRATFIKTGGSSPAAYSLKKKGYERLLDEKGLQPIRQGDYNLHSYTVVEFLIAAICGSKELPITLNALTNEKQFRQSGIVLEKTKSLEPDAWLQFSIAGSLHSIFLEIDLLTEGKEVLTDKVKKYLSAIQKNAHPGFTSSHMTIAFITADGTQENTNRLLRIIEEAVKNNPADGAYFLVAVVNGAEITPSDFLTGSFFHRPYDREHTYALIN